MVPFDNPLDTRGKCLSISLSVKPVHRPIPALTIRNQAMKFAALGCLDEQKLESMPTTERDAKLEECVAYEAVLRKSGHCPGGGVALKGVRTAKTLRLTGGKVVVSDGPFIETKEVLGGFWLLDARDMEHAIELMSKHPGLQFGGPFEIRPVDEEFTARCQGG